MSTTATFGSVSANSTAPTVITFTPLARTLMLTVSDGDAGGICRFTVNSEAVNATSNSSIPCSGIAVPIVCPSPGIGTLTLYANSGASNQSYTVANIQRYGN